MPNTPIDDPEYTKLVTSLCATKGDFTLNEAKVTIATMALLFGPGSLMTMGATIDTCCALITSGHDINILRLAMDDILTEARRKNDARNTPSQ